MLFYCEQKQHVKKVLLALGKKQFESDCKNHPHDIMPVALPCRMSDLRIEFDGINFWLVRTFPLMKLYISNLNHLREIIPRDNWEFRLE